MVISEQPLAGFSDVFVERGAPAEMRDSATLRADIYRPSSRSPFPMILVRLPSDTAQGLTYHRPHWHARHTMLHDAGRPSHLTLTVVKG